MSHEKESHAGLLISAIGITIASYCTSIYFMLSFATSSIEKVIVVLIAITVTTFACVMWKTNGVFWRMGRWWIAVPLILINLGVFGYEFHGWAGFSSELNAKLENNSEYAVRERQMIELETANAKALQGAISDPKKSQSEIWVLGSQNAQLKKERGKCKTFGFSCRAAINEQVKANDKAIELKEAETKRLDQYLTANQKAKRTISSLLNNEGDYNKAHPVFKKMSFAFYGDLYHAMIIQGRILASLAFLLTVLEMMLPFYAQKLCFAMKAVNQETQSNLPPPENKQLYSFKESFNNGDSPLWDLFKAKRKLSPSTVASLNTPVDTPVFKRGHAETVLADTDTLDTLNTPPYSSSKIGFNAESLTKSGVDTAKHDKPSVPKPVNRVPAYAPDRVPEHTLNREQSDRQLREHQKSYADLVDEIVHGSVFANRYGASVRAVKKFMRCRTNIAQDFRKRLIAEEIINQEGRVIK